MRLRSCPPPPSPLWRAQQRAPPRSAARPAERALCVWPAADDKRTALHLAASEGKDTIVHFLLENGADVNPRDRCQPSAVGRAPPTTPPPHLCLSPRAARRWGGTPLSDAIKHVHGNVADTIRGAGGELGFDEVTASGELCELARTGKMEALAQMVRGLTISHEISRGLR